MATDRVTLPENIRPTDYKLTLKPNFSNFTFSGEVTIALQVLSATDRVELNSRDLEVQETRVVQNSAAVAISSTTYDEKLERHQFALASSLQVGTAEIFLRFTGTLNDQLCGFYRSTYEIDGEKRYIATTQFEAVDARRAFPCWDEPACKATFAITLIAPADMTALSNMEPVKSSTDADGWQVVEFAPTPVCSTYILAWSIGHFEYIEGRTSDGVRVRVYTTPGKKHLGEFALDVAVKTLPYYNGYFGSEYPLTKCDMIAIPDFAAGAMENWGLITYREIAILIDEQKSAIARKIRVAETVAHELAHQWFGNLVTMEWWTHLWLNEGFATWVAYLAMNQLFPQWKVWELFLNNNTASAFNLDALETSHPIEVDIKAARDIDEVFDAISYNKGASVINMVASFLTEDVFRKGMRAYLAKHKYANASTSDLWASLQLESGKPVSDIMRSWTKQIGFPVLTVKREGSELVISQQRFLSNGKTDDSTTVWVVPITLLTSTGETQAIVMDKQTIRVPVNVGDNGWVKLNTGQAGFYRVAYEPALFEQLCKAVEQKAISTIDRFGVVSDVFALAQAGYSSTAEALKVLGSCHAETEYMVMADVMSSLNDVLGVFSEQPYKPKLQAFTRNLLKPLFDSLGWVPQAGETQQRNLLRSSVLATLGAVEEGSVVAEAQRLFKSGDIHPDLRGPVYVTTVANGGAAEFDAMIALYNSAEMQEEKMRALRSLGFARKPELLQRALEFGFSDAVRSQDTVFVFAAAGSNPYGSEVTWEFLKSHWNVINGRYGKGGFLLNSFISSATENFSDLARIDEIKAFFAANPIPSAERTLAQSLERVALNAQWIARDAAAVGNFLASK
eukprot:TRINITY_DN4053_c0_g1_i1.p1 TRINITY_DN4053_c0_g1~~TRINITY_DN4053_c0_g1_i1.p1  ORF type:complete len:874 (+),score=242.11 TRINITY_DN4053_c0_g1_i1:78-2624(+)